MNTKHPLFKAFKNGKLMEFPRNAIGPLIESRYGDHKFGSSVIDTRFCDDIRFFTGFEDSKGEPIYDGDTVNFYINHTNNPLSNRYRGTIYKHMDGMWMIDSLSDSDYSLYNRTTHGPVTLFMERRHESRRDTNDRRKS